MEPSFSDAPITAIEAGRKSFSRFDAGMVWRTPEGRAARFARNPPFSAYPGGRGLASSISGGRARRTLAGLNRGSRLTFVGFFGTVDRSDRSYRRLESE
jgi:hypothetical protein